MTLMHGYLSLWPSPPPLSDKSALFDIRSKRLESTHACLFIRQVAVSRQHLALELLLVVIPQLSGLTIQGTSTAHVVSFELKIHSKGSTVNTYLLGSPSKLCKLSNTVCTL